VNSALARAEIRLKFAYNPPFSSTNNAYSLSHNMYARVTRVHLQKLTYAHMPITVVKRTDTERKFLVHEDL